MPVTILDQDGDTVEASIPSPVGPLIVICRVALQDGRLVLYDLHVHGPGPGALGPVALRTIVREVMEQFDVRMLEIRGFARTTGAAPGRIPGPLVFRRA